jgi:hypothetical protein
MCGMSLCTRGALDMSSRGRSTAALYAMKPLVLVLAILLLPDIAPADSSECEVGATCTIHGVLRIFVTPPAPTSILEADGMCIPLALPADVFADSKRWMGKSVTIVGVAHAHAVAPDVTSYQLGERSVTGSLCRSSPIAIFVTKLKATK